MVETVFAVGILALVMALAIEWATQRVRAKVADRNGHAVSAVAGRIAGYYRLSADPENLDDTGGWQEIEDPHQDAAVRGVIGSVPGLFRRKEDAGADCDKGEYILGGGAEIVIAQQTVRHREGDDGNDPHGLARGEMLIRVAVRTVAPPCRPDVVPDPPGDAARIPGVMLLRRTEGLDFPADIRDRFGAFAEPADGHLIALTDVRRCDVEAFRVNAASGNKKVFPESHDVVENPDGTCTLVPRPGWVADTQHVFPELRPGTGTGEDNPAIYDLVARLRGCAKRTRKGLAHQQDLVGDLQKSSPAACFERLAGCPVDKNTVDKKGDSTSCPAPGPEEEQ